MLFRPSWAASARVRAWTSRFRRRGRGQARLPFHAAQYAPHISRHARTAGIHGVVTRAISGHATPEMQQRYSTGRASEVRSALSKVAKNRHGGREHHRSRSSSTNSQDFVAIGVSATRGQDRRSGASTIASLSLHSVARVRHNSGVKRKRSSGRKQRRQFKRSAPRLRLALFTSSLGFACCTTAMVLGQSLVELAAVYGSLAALVAAVVGIGKNSEVGARGP